MTAGKKQYFYVENLSVLTEVKLLYVHFLASTLLSGRGLALHLLYPSLKAGAFIPMVVGKLWSGFSLWFFTGDNAVLVHRVDNFFLLYLLMLIFTGLLTHFYTLCWSTASHCTQFYFICWLLLVFSKESV